MRRGVRTLAAIAVGSILSGCATHDFTVDARSGPIGSESTGPYQLNASPDVANPLEPTACANLATYVKTALSSKGLFEASPTARPDMIVQVEYGVSPPRTLVHRLSRPVTSGPMPLKSINPTGVTNRSQSTLQTIVHSRRVYSKFLRLTAYDNSGTEPGQQIWFVEVTNQDTSPQLEPYLGFMTAAAMDLIGTDTGSRQSLRLTSQDRRVRFILRGRADG